MRYVRMWYIIRHTKTKIIARVHTAHGTRHACRLFFWDVSIRNSLRSNNIYINTPTLWANVRGILSRGHAYSCQLDAERRRRFAPTSAPHYNGEGKLTNTLKLESTLIFTDTGLRSPLLSIYASPLITTGNIDMDY